LNTNTAAPHKHGVIFAIQQHYVVAINSGEAQALGAEN
jgi:hypothetical protein